jgi:hypothetical protein
MGMVEMPVDQIVHMVAMGHCLMTAARSVPVLAVMAAAVVVGRAALGIVRPDVDHVLVDMALMGMMEVPIVQVVHVIAMLDGDMPAIGPVAMRVILMDSMLLVGHDCFPRCWTQCCSIA